MQYNYTGYGGQGAGGGGQFGSGGGGGMGMGMGGGMGGQPSFLSAQPTGFPQQQQPMQPMQTGFRPSNQQTGMGMGMNSFQQPQPTGQPQNNYSFLQSQPTGFRPSMNMNNTGNSNSNPGQITGYPGGGASGLMPMHTGVGGLMSQPTGAGLAPQPTGMGMGGGMGLMPQQTGFLRAQPTGIHDPRLQTMMQSFMPSNMSQPLNNAGAPQFAAPSSQLTSQFQSLLDNPKIRTPKVPWTLSKQEKKDYDQIFRAWDVQGEGFIHGEMAREVFGQSGLGQNDLIKIWNLSDVHNRGKLNLPEFHVAMGLIYRALNGNDIPDELPEELVPASARDIDSTVHFMRDLLKHETSSRSATSSPGLSDPRLSAANSKDAKVYKHNDTSSGAYKPSSRHLDRKSVRYSGEDPDADISDIRRQLQNTSMMLDRSAADSERKSAEDEQIEQEMDDLKYRVKRLQEDIDYVSKGRRSAEKDEERRKLERELLFLMHEKLPELERRQKQRQEEKDMEERAGVRARDRRNDGMGRFRDDERERESGGDWLKGSYDRDRRDRERERDDYYRRDDRDRDRERRRSTSRDRYRRDSSPPHNLSNSSRAPPPAPSAPSADAAPPPAPAPPTSAKAAAPSTRNMTPEERKEFIRAQAQARIQERLRALGVESSPAEAEPAVDNSVQERLERERKEAEEKSKKAEEEQKEREEARRRKMGLGSSEEKEPEKEKLAAPASPSPAPLKSALKKPAPPPSSAPAPPPSRSAKAPPAPPASRGKAPAAPTPAAPTPAPAPPAQEEDPEEAEFRAKEEARVKAREERRARLAAMEAEEEEERKKEEELLAARRNRSTGVSPAPAASTPPPPPPPPPAPPAEPTSTPAAAQEKGQGYNPFRKPGGGGAQGAASPAASVTSPVSQPPAGGFNPFFRPPSAAATAKSPEPSIASAGCAPPPPPPPPVASAFRPAPVEDDWEEIREKDDDSDSDSSDDDYATSRASRGALASALFGNLAGGGGGSRPGSGPASPAPGQERKAAAPSAALAKLGGGDAGSGAGRGALLSAIQGGARLKKATTVVKGNSVGGKVIGDSAPPEHIRSNTEPVPEDRRASPSPPPVPTQLPPRAHDDEPAQADEEGKAFNDKRQSVDWYSGLAADQANGQQGHAPAAAFAETNALESTREEDEKESGDLDEFDLTKEIRVRSLYPYEGQRDADLSFAENVVIVAHPAKDPGGEWWYGTTVKGGEKGWFPHSFVSELGKQKARALFPYEGGEADQLPFLEGDELTIVDSSETDWWKTEKAGVIFIVPAAFLELIDGTTDVANRNESVAPRSETFPTPASTLAPRTVSTPPADDQISSSLLPPTLTRLRSDTVTSTRSATSIEEGYESSSGDSVLSWWSSDDDSEAEEGEVDEHKESERKRREEERLKILAGAGLQLRREPPPVPGPRSTREEVDERGPEKPRRPAPAAPKRRRRAPAVPPTHHTSTMPDGGALENGKDVSTHHALSGPTDSITQAADAGATEPPEAQVQDAYARYEQFLANQASRPKRSRANSAARPASLMLSPTASTTGLGQLSPQMTGQSATPHAGSPHLPASAGSSSMSPQTSQQQHAAKEGKLSGFISRIKHTAAETLSEGSSKSTPARKTISGPIVRVQQADGEGSEGGAEGGSVGSDERMDGLGKTWASLVDEEILATMSSRERKRQEAIFEFIATESAYNRDLQLIVNVFYASLLPILDEKAQTVIFANIEDILLFNTSFLSSLEERQRKCRLYIDEIGDVLETNAPGAGVYEAYCVNQQTGERVLRGLRGSDARLEQHLKDIRDNNPDVRGLDLSSFLLIPMQRITRYPLLLKQIANYTEPDQDLVGVQHALRAIERTVSNINESIREAESYERLRVLSEDLWVGGEGRIDLTAPTAFQGPRRLLKEGVVTKAKSGRKLTLVLCTDILILIESRNLYRMPIPLFELSVREGSRDGFVIKVDRQRGGDTINLKAASGKDAKDWVGLIEGERRRSVDARKMVHSGFAQQY